jgi:hypothetical protein
MASDARDEGPSRLCPPYPNFQSSRLFSRPHYTCLYRVCQEVRLVCAGAGPAHVGRGVSHVGADAVGPSPDVVRQGSLDTRAVWEVWGEEPSERETWWEVWMSRSEGKHMFGMAYIF